MDHGAWQLFGNLSSAFLSKSQEKDWHDCSQSCCTPMPLEVQVAQASIYTHTAYGWMAPSWMAPGWTTHCRHHLGHHELMNSWNSKWAPIWDTLTSLPGRSKNGLWERLANHQSCGARHADNIGPSFLSYQEHCCTRKKKHIGPSFFPAQNTLASRAGKSVVFFRSEVYLNAPWITHVLLSPKVRSRADETHTAFADVRLVYVKPSFLDERPNSHLTRSISGGPY